MMRLAIQKNMVSFALLMSLVLAVMRVMNDSTVTVHAVSFAASLVSLSSSDDTNANNNVATTAIDANHSTGNSSLFFSLPTQFSSTFPSYPNVLCITETEQRTFHPVLYFPTQCWRRRRVANDKHDQLAETSSNAVFVCPATDFTSSFSAPTASDSPVSLPPPPPKKRQLLSDDEFHEAQRQRQAVRHPQVGQPSRPLQTIIYRVRQRLQHYLRYPFRTIIPSIQFVLDQHEWRILFLRRWLTRNKTTHRFSITTKTYIGKYDEDRIGLYTSDLFRNNNEKIQTTTNTSTSNDPTNTCPYRSVHVGIDLSIGGRAGTPVYAFIDGHIHSVGYNPKLGDYGNVIVVEHYWYRPLTNAATPTTTSRESLRNYCNSTPSTTPTTTNPEKVTVYALYGHLSDRSILYKQVNDTIRKGQVIGYIGNVNENGGWYVPHLHFQVSTVPPDHPHDMPGAICYHDRNPLLYQYFDPRYILGAVH